LNYRFGQPIESYSVYLTLSWLWCKLARTVMRDSTHFSHSLILLLAHENKNNVWFSVFFLIVICSKQVLETVCIRLVPDKYWFGVPVEFVSIWSIADRADNQSYLSFQTSSWEFRMVENPFLLAHVCLNKSRLKSCGDCSWMLLEMLPSVQLDDYFFWLESQNRKANDNILHHSPQTCSIVDKLVEVFWAISVSVFNLQVGHQYRVFDIKTMGFKWKVQVSQTNQYFLRWFWIHLPVSPFNFIVPKFSLVDGANFLKTCFTTIYLVTKSVDSLLKLPLAIAGWYQPIDWKLYDRNLRTETKIFLQTIWIHLPVSHSVFIVQNLALSLEAKLFESSADNQLFQYILTRTIATQPDGDICQWDSKLWLHFSQKILLCDDLKTSSFSSFFHNSKFALWVRFERSFKVGFARTI
jgi:hypothetical protein